MMSRVAGTAAALASFFFYAVSTANGQTTAEASRSSAVASPTYVSLYMEVTVNRPAADVWKRFGGYCAVAEWMNTPCTITSGKDGELGAGRTLGGGEVLVGKTPASYTYTQPVKDGQPVQPLPRHVRGEVGHHDNLEADLRLHLRQLDAAR